MGNCAELCADTHNITRQEVGERAKLGVAPRRGTMLVVRPSVHQRTGVLSLTHTLGPRAPWAPPPPPDG
jgi:hypothetical protein